MWEMSTKVDHQLVLFALVIAIFNTTKFGVMPIVTVRKTFL
jgi:hypothetical protein